jgi:hypothetical protein
MRSGNGPHLALRKVLLTAFRASPRRPTFEHLGCLPKANNFRHRLFCEYPFKSTSKCSASDILVLEAPTFRSARTELKLSAPTPIPTIKCIAICDARYDPETDDDTQRASSDGGEPRGTGPCAHLRVFYTGNRTKVIASLGCRFGGDIDLPGRGWPSSHPYGTRFSAHLDGTVYQFLRRPCPGVHG